MPTVKLIDYTGAGRPDAEWHAANILIFTKDTRLTTGANSLADVAGLPMDAKVKLLNEMARTIPSSWEFVNVTFEVSGLSRAAAQQVTRTRTASYAMQSLRVVDGSEVGVVNPFDQGSIFWHQFTQLVSLVKQGYDALVASGAKREDARGILPLNTKSSLILQYNLRTFSDLIKSRESIRTQGEYREMVAMMKAAVLDVWPWASLFLQPNNSTAIAMLDEVIAEVGLEVGSGLGWKLAKVQDLLRKG